MTEDGAVNNGAVDHGGTDSGAVAAAPSPPLPDDFYVTLQPMTLGLVGRQLQRMSIRFTEDDEHIAATGTDGFRMEIRILAPDLLTLRVFLDETFPLGMQSALEARCNWWNQNQVFLKASVRSRTPRAGDDPDGPEPDGPADSDGLDGLDPGTPPQPVATVDLDLDLPFTVGIAPVQIQSILGAVLRNVTSFRRAAQLDALRLTPGWD